MPNRYEPKPSASAYAAHATAEDHVAISDALLRFAAGVDGGEGDCIAAAFTEAASVDFSPCGRMLGHHFPLLQGRERIVGFLAATADKQITTHVVANLRTRLAGEAAALTALVEATHIPRDRSPRRFRMMNRYAADLAWDGDLWRMRRMVITGVWSEGDADVLLAR